MNNLEKLMIIAHKHNFYLTDEDGEFKVLKVILDNMDDVERTQFFADTFSVMDNEINAVYDACRDLSEDELYDIAQEDKHEYQKDIA